ncbi:hypothetical protein LB504_013128, partial [Fusarium proliferatum]
QKQLMAAFRFEQEFEPDASDIRRMGKNVKEEINFAKAQADRQDQMLQEKERVAASKQRSRLRKFIPKVESELDTIKELQVQRSTRRSIKERHRLIESLSSHDYETPFREARKKHQHSTAEWIIATSEFIRWYEGTGSVLLWCSGKIGSGKTILCANVINHVLVKKNRDDHVAFFFLQYDNSDSLTAETIIRSIIRQSVDVTTLPEQIEHQLQELSRKHFVPLQDWEFLLRQIIKTSDTLTRHADGMFLWVTFLIDEICIAVCDDDIRQSLHSLPKNLEETFVRALSRIMSRQKKTGLAQKVFRWVAVAKRPLTLDEIREAVSIGIGQPYLKSERLVREISLIVLWCENLLQVTEDQPPSLQFAHSTIREFITKGDLPTQLSNFHIDVDEADHFAGEICITYLHLNDFKTTVAQRLQPLRVNPIAIAGSVLSRGPTELTSRFVDVFGHRRAKAGPDLAGALASYDRADGIDRLHQSHPFLRYAAKHWVSHTGNFQKETSSTWNLWYQIITNGHTLAHVPWQEPSFHRKEEAILFWSHQAHHYALLRYANSILGLAELKRMELMRTSASEGDDEAIAIFLDDRCSMICIDRAFQAASAGGHIQVVERLLEAGADANASAGYQGRTALQAASAGGHMQVIERLLEAGARKGNLITPN